MINNFLSNSNNITWSSLWLKFVNNAQFCFANVKASRRIFAYDLAVSGASIAIAYLLRLGFFNEMMRYEALLILVPMSILSAAIVYPVFGLYKSYGKSTSLRDVVRIARVASVMVLFVIAAAYMTRTLSNVPRSVFIIQVLVATPLLGFGRLYHRRRELGLTLPRIIKRDSETNQIPVLLVGTGTACDLFLRALSRDPNATYDPIGVLDDVQETRGQRLFDVPILGSIRQIDEVIATMEASGKLPRRLILTEPSSRFEASSMQKLLAWAENSGVVVSRLPGICELKSMSDQADFGMLDIEVTDLLNRPQTVVDSNRLANMISGRRVVVTGAGGSIGSELARQIASLGPKELVLIDNTEFNLYSIDMDLGQHFPDVKRRAHICDVRDRNRVYQIFSEHIPELVFHAAALKHVPMVELNPCEGALTNAIGTRNVADAARSIRAMAMVNISTDKAVNTTNVMGATKRVAEFYCQALDRKSSQDNICTRFMTVRFGNVLGSSGSLIPLFQRQIAQGGPLTVTDARMERFFMTIREAVELTLLASASGLNERSELGQIFVLDMGEPIKIIDIADRMIRMAGLRSNEDIDIDIVGIRPGEKLFEELFDEKETPLASSVPGVMAAIPTGVELNRLRTLMGKIETVAHAGLKSEVIETLAELVPGYESAAVSNVTPILKTETAKIITAA